MYGNTTLYYNGNIKANSLVGNMGNSLPITGSLAVNTITPNSTNATANITLTPKGNGILIIDESTSTGGNNSVTVQIDTGTVGGYRVQGPVGAAFIALQDNATDPYIYLGGSLNSSADAFGVITRNVLKFATDATEIQGPVRITQLSTNLTPKVYFSSGFTSATAMSESYTNGLNSMTYKGIDYTGTYPVSTYNGKIVINNPVGVDVALDITGGLTKNLTGVWDVISDIKMKKDITDIEPGLATKIIKECSVKKFKYKDGRIKDYVFGLIAQDVQKIQEKYIKDIDTMTPEMNGTLLYNGAAVPFLLISCIQDILKRLDEMDLKMEAIADELNAIKK